MVICKRCWKEQLMSDVTVSSLERSGPSNPPPVKRKMTLDEFKDVSSTKIPRKEEHMKLFKPGNHVIWLRPYLIYHHAIVSISVGESDDQMLKVLHPEKVKCVPTIKQKSINYSKERGNMFQAFYNETVTKNNPPGLVLARAYAFKGSRDYHLFTRNCENYAIFCKTGINFNHQFPWLILKIEETFTSTLLRLIKSLTIIPMVTTIIFSEGVESTLNIRQEVIGASMVVFLEFVSLVNNLANMYFEYKYPASCYKLNRGEFMTRFIMRVFEFVFGAAGMVLGSISCEQLTIHVGKEVCPGLGELVGEGLSLLFGTIGGFVLGALGKVLGNLLGLLVSRSTCCNKSEGTDAEPLMETPPSDGDIEMQKLFYPSSWLAKLGFAVIILNTILLIAFSNHYIVVYRNFSNCVQSNCITTETTFESNTTFPCVIIRVNVFDSPLNTTFRDLIPIGNDYQLFEGENTFANGHCSFYPKCLTNSTMSNKMVDNYVRRFGYEGANFSCYHQFNDSSKVIREFTPVKTFVHMFLWPTFFLCIGIILILVAIANHKNEHKKDCFSTFIIVIGMWSYLDNLKRCRLCLCNRKGCKKEKLEVSMNYGSIQSEGGGEGAHNFSIST